MRNYPLAALVFGMCTAACSSSHAGSGGAGGNASSVTSTGQAPDATSGSTMTTATSGTGGGSPLAAFTCAPTDPGPLTPTYFVDYSSGDDSADGKSQTTPWKHAPGDASATANAASIAVAPGDVVLFKGGVSYLGTIDIPVSGTQGSLVVYDGNSRGTWGTGHAIIDGEEKRSAGIRMASKSFVLVDSFDIQSFDKSQSSTGVSIEDGSDDEVRNCHIKDVYYPTNPGGTSWEQQSGTGISVNDSPRTSIHNNVVRDVGNAGITFTAESGNVIDGGNVSCNEVTNMNWGIAVALGNSTPGTKITNVKLLGNYIHDFDQYYVCAAWHRDGVFVFARPDTDQASVENLEIAYNYFEDNTSALGSTAWLYFEFVCKNFQVHHNVLNASRSYYAIRVLGDGFQVEGNHVFENNVIDNANGIGDGMHVQESSGITMRNNIFYVDGNAYIVATSSMSGFTSDYDLLWRSDGQPSHVILNAGPADAPGGDSYLLPALQTASGNEQHGIDGDPLFSVAPAMIDSDPTGFAPKAGSPAIDHGTDLGFKSDFSGNPIPSGAAADIGAFEAQSH